MGRATDPRHRFEREKERIADSAGEDAEPITEFLRALDGDDLTYKHTENGQTDTKAASTLTSYGRALRLLTKEIEGSLLDATAKELNEQFTRWKGDLADKTIKQRQSALIKFLKYHGVEGEADHRDIVMIQVDQFKNSIDPEDVFTGEDIAALREACTTDRDRCLVDLLVYTGQRIRALQTLRLKDVDPEEGASGRYELNTDELGLKGADENGKKRPLLGAQKAVREWKRKHPTGEPDDYLITALQGSNRPGDVERGDYLGRTSIRSRLIQIAERADVDKDVNPHAFRHFFVTTCKRDYDMDDADVKFLIGHDAGSRVMETTYAHLSDEDHNLSSEEDWGYEDESRDSPLTPPTCWTCDEPLPGDAKACPSCGAMYTPDAQAVNQQMEGDVKQSYRETDPDDADTQEDIDALDNLLDDPEMKAELLNRLEGELKAELLGREDE